DPLKWTLKFKCWATAVYCLMILSTTYGSSSYAASAITVEREWGLSRPLATSGTSLWVLGFAVGPLLFGPTSEVVGRRPVYLVSFALLTIANIVACVAPDIEVLLAMRFIGGCMGSSALNNVAASISDMVRVRDRLRYLTMYRIVSFGGPTLGPLVGTFLNQASWRWNLAVLPFFSFATLVLYATTVPESHRVTIARKQLEQRQKEHEKEVEKLCEEGKMTRSTGDRSNRELGGPSLMQRYKTALSMPFVLLFTEPIVGIVCIYTALLYGLLYGIIAAFPLVWQDIRGRSPEYASTVFLTLLGGFCLGAGLIGCWLQDKSYKRQYDAGEVTPESRIGPATWASFFVPVGLFVFGWTAPYDRLVGSLDIHWAVPCIALVIFAFGMQVVFNSWLSYLGDAYAPVAASAMAAATFSRSLLGAAFPLFLRQWMLVWSVQIVFSILGGLSILLSFGGLLFVRYGPRIRAR
ncbi:MFS general substrate transporter, partial [Ceraceosorus guamensis]